MSENVKNYSKLCSKIGLAMLLFYAFFTLSTFAVALVSSLLEASVGKFASEVVYEIFAAIVYFFSFSVAAFILRKITKDAIGARPIYTSFKIDKWIMLSIVAIIAVNFTVAYLNTVIITSLSPSLASNLASTPSEMEGRPLGEVAVFFVLSIISTAVVPAVCEEYLFRGAVLTRLLPFGRTTAIIGSAFLFGFMHQNPLQLLYTTLMGVVIGYVYVKTKSIWVCILIHFANNFISVLEEYLPILTKVEWIDDVLDIAVMVVGAIALLLIVLKKDKEPSIEKNGSFGAINGIGLDVEEYELDLSQGQKVRRFFAPTVIIYSVICIFTMVITLLSFFNLQLLS